MALSLFFTLAVLTAGHARASENSSSSPESHVTEHATEMAACQSTRAGGPPFGVDNTPGSSRIAPSVSHHVAYSIDVVSGNKYQYELDYKSFASGLTLARHYNSLLSECEGVIGYGWRHTYQVSLLALSQEQIDIIQSDGRLIHFTRTGDASGGSRFDPESPSDGYLEFGDTSVWHMVDGRQLRFNGALLTAIDFGDYRGVLQLSYRDERLDSVTDFRGDSLEFQYERINARGSISNTDSGQHVLTSLILPSGDSVKFKYGEHAETVSVLYPDGDSVGYGYGNERWKNHLTLRQSTSEDRTSEWRYDEGGLAVEWIEDGGRNGLTIDRISEANGADSIESPVSTGAIVTYEDGRQSHYSWSYDENDNHHEPRLKDFSCDDCRPCCSWLTNPSVEASVRNELEMQAADSHRPVDPVSKAIPPLWDSLERFHEDAPAGDGTAFYTGKYLHEQGVIPFRIKVDRTGEIKGMQMGKTAFLDLIRQSRTKRPVPCFTGKFPPNPESFRHDRLFALGSGESPCNLDVMVVLELIQKLESYSSWGTVDN